MVTDVTLPRDHRIMEGIGSVTPAFNITDVGKIFFAKKNDWVRWRERQGFVFDGEPLLIPRDESGYRTYTLPIIEKMAHALAQGGRISGQQLNLTLHVIQAEARLWGQV